MKKTFTLLILTLFAATAAGQGGPQTFLWPVEGQPAGSGILYTPQSYVDGEHNFESLFIGAPEGTTVVAPCDGTIFSISLGYYRSLTYSLSFRYDGDTASFDEVLEQMREEGFEDSIDPRYVSGSIGVRMADGRKIYFSGLTGGEIFKTGQKITRGTPIGRVGYSYYKIREPSISLSISTPAGKADDPMTPFGLKTTFIPPGEIKPVESLTREEAREDFTIYIDILREAYPGLYNVLSEQELAEYEAAILAEIDSRDGNIPYDDFRTIMVRTVARIHDSHIYMHGTVWRDQNERPSRQPKIWFGALEDGILRCTNATEEYEHFIGREIAAVNGVPADSVKNIITGYTTGYDAGVESYKLYRLATLGMGSFFSYIGGASEWDMAVEFADGHKEYIEGQSTRRGMPKWKNDIFTFINANRHGSMYKTDMLNDSTAYLSLATFSLSQVQVEEIAAFIDSVAAVPHLIVDVRNNGGGDVNVLNKLYSYIAGEPMTLDGYRKVNKRGGFDAYKYALNYSPEVSNDIFPEYEPEEGKEGFYSRSEAENVIVPDSLINYKGRVYVLADENSVSAATVFPALLVRNHRGVVVGRETRTAYHFMNALKFMDIRLPNSMITITVPLVELVFDTAVNDRVPFGRGALPDYYVPLTMDGMTSANGDDILNRALELIENGEYLTGDDPFAVPEKPDGRGTWYTAVLIFGCVLVAAILVVTVARRAKKKTN